MSICRKIESDGKGADTTDREGIRQYVKACVDNIPPKEFPKMLDLGAGDGTETSLLIEYGYDVTGLTLGIDNVTEAMKKYNISLLEHDMHFLAFPPKFFDAAIYIQAFEHYLSWYVGLGELYFVLRPGARVYVDYPNPDEESMRTIWHTNLQYPQQVRWSFEYWGFQEIKYNTENDNRWQQTFERLSEGDSRFKNYGYLQHILKIRENIWYQLQG